MLMKWGDHRTHQPLHFITTAPSGTLPAVAASDSEFPSIPEGKVVIDAIGTSAVPEATPWSVIMKSLAKAPSLC